MIKKAAKRFGSFFILIEKTEKGYKFRFTIFSVIVVAAALIALSRFGVITQIANAISLIIRGK